MGKYYYGDKLLVNGNELTETFHRNWFKVNNVNSIDSLSRLMKGKSFSSHYQLIDKSLVSDKIPEIINLDDACYTDDEDGDPVWTSKKYPGIGSLYEVILGKEDDYYEDVEFIAECLGEINVKYVDTIPDIKVSMERDGFCRKKESINLSSIVNYDELVQMFVPDLIIHTQPCYLTSRQTYDIVREYVKDNIDKKNAVITSDYDFCLEVHKKIKIKPIIFTKEEKKSNGRSYAKPRITTKEIQHKNVLIFEMTHADRKYEKYTVIDGFKGESLQDLIDNIKHYLDELMEVINSEMSECEYCNGTGHVINYNFDINKR